MMHPIKRKFNPLRCVVLDLDGTLCDIRHREQFAQTKQWDEFHKRCEADLPYPDVAGLLRLLSLSGTRTIGLTGRNEAHRPRTLEWLATNRLELDELVMRPDGDWRPDHDLKPQLLIDLFSGKVENALQEVSFILEDRDKVVEAWRNLGFRCWQVQPGGY